MSSCRDVCQTMCAIEPDTEYQLYTVRLAVPLRFGVAARCDGINETLVPGSGEMSRQFRASSARVGALVTSLRIKGDDRS